MNNVLAAIMGMASALRTPRRRDPGRALDTIIRACHPGPGRGQEPALLRPQGPGETGPVDLNAIAQEVVQLLSYTTLTVRLEWTSRSPWR